MPLTETGIWCSGAAPTSQRASSEPSVLARCWSRTCGEDSLRPLTEALSLYSLSSSWTKCVSSSPGRSVSPQTGQQDGSSWNFFLPGEHRILLRQKAVLLILLYCSTGKASCSCITDRLHGLSHRHCLSPEPDTIQYPLTKQGGRSCLPA